VPDPVVAEAPVVGGAGDVEAPGLVNVIRRTHRRAGEPREHEEAAIFADDADGASQGPAVVVGQPALEGERIARCGKGVVLDARQQRGGGGSGLVVRVTRDGNLPFLSLWSLVVVARSVLRRPDCRQSWEATCLKAARPNESAAHQE
jgi:hypothetical protein